MIPFVYNKTVQQYVNRFINISNPIEKDPRESWWFFFNFSREDSKIRRKYNHVKAISSYIGIYYTK